MERKLEKSEKILLTLFGTMAVACIALLIPSVQEIFLKIGEFILHRELRKPEKWIGKMQQIGIGGFVGFSIISVIVFFKLSNLIYNFFCKNCKIFIIAIAILYSVLAIFICFISSDIWFDEAFTVSICTHSSFDLIRMTANDVHPPLYYLLLKFFTSVFGKSIYIFRLFSVLPVIIFLFVGINFLNKEFSSKAASIFVLLACASNSVLEFSHEIRNYTWAMLFCGLCAVFSYYIINREKFSDWFMYVVFAICSAYTHYFAALLILFNFIPLCIYKYLKSPCSRKYIYFSCTLGVLLYAPWIPIVLLNFTSVKNSFWLSKPTFRDIVDCFEIISPTLIPVKYVGLLFAIITILHFVIKEKSTFWHKLMLATPISQIFIGLTISFLVRPIFFSKYALPGIFFMIVFMALAISNLKNTRFFICILAFLLLSSLSIIRGNINSEKSVSSEYKDFISVISPSISEDTEFILVDDIEHGFIGHQQGVLATLFPHHKFYTENANDKWAALFNSTFLSFDEIIPNKPFCIVMDNKLPDPKQAEFIGTILDNNNWMDSNFILVSPSHYRKYRIYFFH